MSIKLSKKQRQIYKGQICPYCNSKSKKVPMEYVYGRRYGKGHDVFCCIKFPKCDSYVGTHKDGKALGRLANKDLRKLKKIAHDHFDKIWKKGFLSRNRTYKELSEYLGIPKRYTHIGMFSEITCIKVIEWSINKLKSYDTRS